jgi:3-aminobutyryl-CoA ammonia-lyase
MSNSPSAYVGLSVTHRRYVTHGDAHYGGNLVNGAFVLELFGDVGTEASIRMDGDEGLLASYSDVQFRAPVLAGDIIEATATVTAVGRRSRQLAFEARVVGRADPSRGDSAASVLGEPIVVVTATGTVVVPPPSANTNITLRYSCPKVVASMQRFKFQALVTPNADDDDDARAKLSSGSHRMVLRAENSETHRSQVFSALVDGEGDGPFRAGSPQIMVTLRVVGDDVSDYLEIGSHFSLWLGSDVGRGVVTRRLLI